jgi:hypothetical protein
MHPLRLLLVVAAILVSTLATSGCADDCRAYCRDAGDLLDGCLPEYEISWSDVGEGFSDAADFVNQCRAGVDEEIARDKEATCEGAEGDALSDCEVTVEQGIMSSCRESTASLRTSCASSWRLNLDYTPGDFVPEEPTPEGDDDDSAGDDDDSAGDDDDSAGDDDDSAGDDDDSAADDDDSAE